MKDEFLKIRNEMEAANVKQNKSLIEKISLLKKSLLKLEKSKQKIFFDCQQKIFEIQKVVINYHQFIVELFTC